MKGFSPHNLKYMRAFAAAWPDEHIVQQAAAQIPWFHNCGLNCLVESKDLGENVPLGPIAKLRYQLLRRPAGTIGLMFSSKSFTEPAVLLAHFALPQAILLWTEPDMDVEADEEAQTAAVQSVH